MSDNLAYEQAQSQRACLADYWDAIDHVENEHNGRPDEDDCETCREIAGEYGDSADDMREYLDEMPLEIVWEVGEPFAVVLGTGGPHVEITGGGRQGGYQLHVYWGGDHSVVTGQAVTRTGEYFREYVEQ